MDSVVGHMVVPGRDREPETVFQSWYKWGYCVPVVADYTLHSRRRHGNSCLRDELDGLAAAGDDGGGVYDVPLDEWTLGVLEDHLDNARRVREGVELCSFQHSSSVRWWLR